MSKKLERFTSRSSSLLLLALGAGAALTFLLQTFKMNLSESYLYDFRVRHQKQRPLSEKIILVKIDDQTIDALSEGAPLSISRHYTLLKKLGQTKPKAIAYLFDFATSISPNGEEPSKETQERASSFVHLADSLITSGTSVLIGTEIDETGERVPPFPLSKIPHRISVLHRDGLTFAGDKVTRRAWFSSYDEPLFHVQLAGLINGKTAPQEYRGLLDASDTDAKYFYINYSSATQENQTRFKSISAIDVLQGKYSSEIFRDKIILIGTQTKEFADDYVYTPYSRESFINPKLIVHANILETLINNNAIIRISRPIDVLITFLLTAFIVAMVFRTSPIHGVLVTTACAGAIFIFGVLLFRYYGIWVCLSHPIMGTFLAYYVFVPYRLIMEYKKRWEFQNKNEVLVQVEELKSNFMNLITHDLKTPVARIQGMAEILGRNGADPKIISEILSSTEELNSFISGILELAKIESNRMQLNKQSKDINKVIEDCVRKLEFQAKAKSISIDLELEPMFPIRFDLSLINKVISNLIDNAIKYSPERTKIVIKSAESNQKSGYVVITISDNGPGISNDDLKNLFSKFYRPKNDLTLQTKGTGLGLYLSRYFVELHNGSLTAESSLGKGSKFTILLPVDEIKLLTPVRGDNAYV